MRNVFQRITYFQKSQIPNDVKTTVKRSGLCDKRISALLENIKVDDNNGGTYYEKNYYNSKYVKKKIKF